MRLTNVRLILAREIRDQLRDRRTLFMVFVLPVLLYPLLGVSLSQMMQFRVDRPTSVLVGGTRELGPDLPPLVVGAGFCPTLFDAQRQADLLQVTLAADGPGGGESADCCEEAGRLVTVKQYDAAVVFPPGFGRRLSAYAEAVRAQAAGPGKTGSPHPPAQAVAAGAAQTAPELPRAKILYTTANERSQIALERLSAVLDRWSEKLGQTNLAAGGLPAAALRPVQIDADDVADGTAYRSANVWSKVLPVLLLIWALTGAFYPAVDLCAGEKERGTLETLLSSPAERGEIVLGKLLTVMLFSAATSALNLASLAVTGCVALGHAAGFSPPPLAGVIWLAVALLPVSALFAALCLALAAMARSTKEGQYYLMPLLLVTLPLTLLPMTPGVELGLGNSLIPITGLVLLLRSALEGSAWQALPFLPTVLAVTLTACWLALRWAIEQFNSESVLFRQGERFNLGLWLRGLLSQRQPTPGVGGAIFCGLAILLVKFFLGAAAAAPAGLAGFARLAVVTQLAVILTPALLMTIILSGSPRQTLLLRLPRWPAIPAAVALAVAVHPLTMALQTAVRQLYPLSEEMRRSLSDVQAMFAAASGWQLVFVLALVPALCEELAFRGFILSGLRQRNRPWRAIVWTAILFGLVHGVLQQSIIACMLGLVLGYLAVQTGSILPPILFHFAHNALVVATTRVTPDVPQRWPALAWLVKSAGEDGIVYHPAVCLLACLAAAALLAWFGRLRPVVLPAEVLAAVGPAADKPAECCV